MTSRSHGLRRVAAFVVTIVIAGLVQVATAATLTAAAEKRVTGTVAEWSSGRFTVKDRSGTLHAFTTDRTTKIEGQPKVGSMVEVVSLQEGPLAIRVKVLPPAPGPKPKAATGVTKS